MAAGSGGQFLPPKRNDSRSTKSGKKTLVAMEKISPYGMQDRPGPQIWRCKCVGQGATLPPAIFLYLYFYLNGVENLYCYTLSHRGPSHHELGSWGLGWTCGT
jgi:hypothetical protein